MRVKRNVVVVTFCLLTSALLQTQLSPANAAWSNYQTSAAHSGIKQSIDINYDVQQVHFGINDSDLSRYYFYLNFVKPVSAKLFNDGKGSFAGINIDLNNDGTPEYSLQSDPLIPYDGNYIHSGIFVDKTPGYDLISSKCAVQTFTDMAVQADWIGFSILRSCLPFQTTFGVQGFSFHDPKGKFEFDLVPDKYWTISIAGATPAPADAFAGAASSTDLPKVLETAETSIANPANPPDDLVALAASETRSVVTISCANSLGSGWAAKVQMTSAMTKAGYKSFIITNHHVIKDCIPTQNVTVTLPNQTKVTGRLWAWDEINDVAGVVIKTELPQLSWQGVAPAEGWWAGVEGSPLGFPGVLTEGIISSVTPTGFLATTTAHINPGNSGGPAFERMGRVIGIATAKYLDAEGFGIIHGAPLLCGKVIACGSTSLIWSANTNPTSSATTDLQSQSDALRAAGSIVLEGAKVVLADTMADLNEAKIDFPSAAAQFQAFKALAPKVPATTSNAAADVTAISAFATNIAAYETLVHAKINAVALTIAKAKAAAKTKTITCVKGAITKKVVGTAPKCPIGYKLKA